MAKLGKRKVKNVRQCLVCKGYFLHECCDYDFNDVLRLKLAKTPIVHHLNYDPEKTILVCASCHAKIHHSNNPKYDVFLPNDERSSLRGKFKFVKCFYCVSKVRIPFDAEEGICLRCHLKIHHSPNQRDFLKNRSFVNCKYCRQQSIKG